MSSRVRVVAQKKSALRNRNAWLPIVRDNAANRDARSGVGRSCWKIGATAVALVPLWPMGWTFFKKGVHPFLSLIAGEAACIDARRKFVGSLETDIQLLVEGPLPHGHGLT